MRAAGTFTGSLWGSKAGEPGVAGNQDITDASIPNDNLNRLGIMTRCLHFQAHSLQARPGAAQVPTISRMHTQMAAFHKQFKQCRNKEKRLLQAVRTSQT